MNKKTTPTFQLSTDVVIPLTDAHLSKDTKTMLMGYEILDACSITMALEDYLWQRYRVCYQDKVSPGERRLIHNYSLIPAYARQVSDAWFGIKDGLNLAYEKYVMKFIEAYEASRSKLNELGMTLELESSKAEFIQILQSLLNQIYYFVGPKIDSILQDLNQFRGYIESQAREAGKQIDHIYREILGKGPSLEQFAGKMKAIQTRITDLNMALLGTIYSNKIPKAILIDQVVVGGRLEINPIALVSNKNEYASLPIVLKTNANELNNHHAELQEATIQLETRTSSEFVSIALLNSELLKLQDLAQTTVQVAVNFRDAWIQLSNNLERVLEGLRELTVIRPELKKIMISIHLESLKSNMESMKEHIQTLEAHQLLKMPIVKELAGKLAFLGGSDAQVAIHPFVLEKYLKEMNYTVCPSSSGS